MKNLNENDLQLIKTEMGSVSAQKLDDTIRTIKNGILVDIGVYDGASSRVMISSSEENNNKIYAIDTGKFFISDSKNWNFIQEDSVKVGSEWDRGLVDLVFFDSVHAKEQVLCELYYWWDLIKEGGWAVFHDTSWKDYVHKPGHPAAGKKTGNTALGYDSYGGIDWETPEKAVENFFNVTINSELRDIENDGFVLNYEDEYVKVETNYALLGMTFVKKKKKFNYKQNLKSWDDIFDKRKILLSFFI